MIATLEAMRCGAKAQIAFLPCRQVRHQFGLATGSAEATCL